MTDRKEQANNRLIQQYKESPNLVALLESHIDEFQVVDDETMNLLFKRDIDTALGANLDVIGRIVDIERPFADTDIDDVFTLAGAPDTGKGFSDLDDRALGGVWASLDAEDGEPYGDELYRLVLRAKIIFNNTNGTLQEMYDFIQFIFGGSVEAVITERVGMVGLNIARPIGAQERLMIEEIFPRAAGIRFDELAFSFEEGAFGFSGNSTNGGFGDVNDAGAGGEFSALIID